MSGHANRIGFYRRGALAGAVFAIVVLAAAGAADVSASNAIRPRAGAPDPRAMVLTSADLGHARVTAQKYFRDRDFPSVISYEREFENGKSGSTSLPYVDSQAEVGQSADTTRRFLGTARAFFRSPGRPRFRGDSSSCRQNANSKSLSIMPTPMTHCAMS